MEKRFGVVLLLLSSYELVQSQCFVSIGLTQFQNLYSLEIRQDPGGNDIFCCCESSYCQYNAGLFSLDTCESLCDTYFVLSFSECQDFPFCSVTKMTNTSVNSDTTTNVNYDFHFFVSSSAIEQVAFEIKMWDNDDSLDDEIDTFDITVNFPSDNQEQVLTGNRGIATITLTYDLTCIEPNSSTTTIASLDLIGTTSVITSTQFITVTYTAITTSTEVLSVTSTSFEVQSVTSTQVINSTSTTIATSTSLEVQSVTSTQIINSTSTTIATSTSTEVQSVTKTATVSTVVTISATPTAITLTKIVSANSSPGEPVGEQSAESSDSTSTIWMSLFILLALLTIVAVMISIYLACLLKKKKNQCKVDSMAGNITFVQTNPLYKQTTATQESDTGEVICSGNISYGKVNTKSDGSKNEENGNEDDYEHVI